MRFFVFIKKPLRFLKSRIELFLFQLHTGFIHSEECHFPQHTGQAKLKAVDVDTRWCKFPAKNLVPSAEFKSIFRGKVLIHHRVFNFVRAHKGQHLVTNRLRFFRVLFFPVTEVSHFDTDSVIAFIAKSLANHNDTLLIRVYCFWRDGLHSGKCSIDFLNCCRLFLVIGIHGSKFFRQLVFIAMADAVTDPRWQRTYGTFGEDPALISEIMAHIIPRIQGSDHGVTEDGVAVTTKHFPGGGARENGFDPHYAAGQWNVYATPGSLETYHLPPFAAAVKAGTSSIMPYYSKPAAAKSAVQHDLAGNTVEMKPYGFAYNKYFIDTMLRGQMGFDGYINSDTGIAHNMAWGVEMLDVPERIGFAVANAGVDIISGLFDNEAGMEAYNRGKNGYYETHPLPEGFAKEELTLTDEALNRAVARTLTELFALGMFENPYRDPDEAARIVATPSDWEAAADAHRRSVVLLKNDGALPLTADKRANKKIYAEAFLKNAKHAADSTAALRKELADTCTLVDDPAQADFALLFVSPSSGEYFNATPGYLELDICEDKTVCNVDANGKPMADTHTETTLHGGKRLAEIAASVHANGGKVITNVNITLAWQLGNVEPLCDVLLAGFDTYRSATLDVIFGCFAPTGKLPLTLPRGDAVLAVNADGVCISPNDVPGYDKDRYMPDSLKDENGKAYAYRDAAGNYYEYGFGLEG